VTADPHAGEPNFPALYLSMQRCDAVYDPDAARAAAAFAALGSDMLGRYCDAGHQAIAHCAAGGHATLTISGTRVSEGTCVEHVCDLYEDVDYAPRDLGGGVAVASGAWEGLDTVWAWARALFAADAVIDVEGHSLGGQRTCLTPLFLPAERIGTMRAFEPPKAANATYWTKFAEPCARLTTIVHERDPWAGWPWLDEELTHQPVALLWLHGGGWSWAADWRCGSVFDSADHGPDSVVAALAALAGMKVAA